MASAALHLGLEWDVGNGVAEVLAEGEEGEDAALLHGGQGLVERDHGLVEGRDGLSGDVGPVLGCSWGVEYE